MKVIRANANTSTVTTTNQDNNDVTLMDVVVGTTIDMTQQSLKVVKKEAPSFGGIALVRARRMAARGEGTVEQCLAKLGYAVAE